MVQNFQPSKVTENHTFAEKCTKLHRCRSLFNCIYLKKLLYHPEILLVFLGIFGDHFVKTASNYEVVMPAGFIFFELIRNDPLLCPAPTGRRH